MSVHEKASTGFVDGSAYEKGRPSYTDEGIDYIANLLQKTPDNESVVYDILELGAGTGKFTQKFIQKTNQGVRYLATEPSDGFLQTLRCNCPSVDVKQCGADAIPVADNSVRLVVAAQCFHWFANNASMTEIRRVLVPGGILAMVWNHKDRGILWVKQIEDIITRYYHEDTPRAITYKWKSAIESYDGFTFGENKMLPGIDFKNTKDFIAEHFCTISVIAALDTKEKQRVRKEFRHILEHDEQIKDKMEIVLPFVTEVYYCTKS